MEITNNREAAHTFSPFPRRTRAFTDTASDGSDLVVAPGASLPDLARMYYGQIPVDPFTGFFAFLNRDIKEKTYSPGVDDPLIFSSWGSITSFKDEAKRLIALLCTEWSQLGLPLKKDEDRAIMIPDTEIVWEALAKTHALHAVVKKHWYDVIFITSNVDILKKACIVRGVIPGWWAASYSGKDAPDLLHFAPAIRSLTKSMRVLEESPAWKNEFKKVSNSVGDPIDTNNGYPYFTSAMSKEGRPDGRIATLERYAGMGTAGYNWEKLLKIVDDRAKGSGCEGYPFLIAPIRRLSAGYKWQHVFKRTSSGLIASHDERGNNTIRIAWMASNLLNLLLSPLQTRWKTTRKLLPGLYHDGEAKRRRLAHLKSSPRFVAEADYSNYDRFIPINVFRGFTSLYLKDKPHSVYWNSILSFLHTGIPVVWPDQVGNTQGNGWIFRPPKLGLLSGLKITSEEGTFVNTIVNLQTCIDAGSLTESSAVDYMLQYRSQPSGSADEKFYIQSDDTLLIASSMEELKKQGDCFKANTERAGIRGSLEVGDRFLMRHTQDGRDTPVPSRVWQNTISNEEPFTDQVKFVVGIAMRSDGLLGFKTYDPFNTGVVNALTRTEIKFTREICSSLLKFLRTAAIRTPLAINLMQTLEEEADQMLIHSRNRASSDVVTKVNRMRKDALLALVAQERTNGLLANIQDPNNWANSLLYQLHKDQYSPASAALLDQISQMGGDVASSLQEISNIENKFYLFAMSKLNIPLTL